jgi:hypothetical protein
MQERCGASSHDDRIHDWPMQEALGIPGAGAGGKGEKIPRGKLLKNGLPNRGQF